MNLAKMKLALEESVKNALVQSLDENVEVTAAYDANSGAMLVELKEVHEVVDNHSSILCYNIKYTEETKEISILAFNRVYIHDSLGIAISNNEAVAISNKFMEEITTVISYGMDRIYNPDKYADDGDDAADENQDE